jgi:starch phosphorylase
MRDALERYMNADLDAMDEEPPERRFWERMDQLPTEELWEAHQRQKLELAIFARGRLRSQFARHGESPATLEELEEVLDPGVLTIGFARRFAGYKRPELVFTDPARLARILNASGRPVQIVFAGKAHPADEPGKRMLETVYRAAADPAYRGRVAFVEDYGIHPAQHLVQGVDVWLNTPRPPLEASGTSGQKAALNGVPQLSILDGWWVEGHDGTNGWAIAPKGAALEGEERDAADAEELYRLLESEVAPAYYDRDADGVPRRWLRLMRRSIRTIAPRFSARRMLKQYVGTLYGPCWDDSSPA